MTTAYSFQDALAQFQDAASTYPQIQSELAKYGLSVDALTGILESLSSAFPEDGSFDIVAFQSYIQQAIALQPTLFTAFLPILPTMFEFLTSASAIVAANMQQWVLYGFDEDAYNLVNAISETGQQLLGDVVEDFIAGNLGADSLTGNNGNDILTGAAGDDQLYGNLGADLLYGNLGTDFMFGGQADDILFGGQGGDELVGGLGNDSLFGNAGDDTMTGGDGEDTFVGALFSGDDVVTDFEVGVDSVQIIGIADESVLVDTAVEVDGGVQLTYDGGSITLIGVTIDDLSVIFA